MRRNAMNLNGLSYQTKSPTPTNLMRHGLVRRGMSRNASKSNGVLHNMGIAHRQPLIDTWLGLAWDAPKFNEIPWICLPNEKSQTDEI